MLSFTPKWILKDLFHRKLREHSFPELFGCAIFGLLSMSLTYSILKSFPIPHQVVPLSEVFVALGQGLIELNQIKGS